MADAWVRGISFCVFSFWQPQGSIVPDEYKLVKKSRHARFPCVLPPSFIFFIVWTLLFLFQSLAAIFFYNYNDGDSTGIALFYSGYVVAVVLTKVWPLWFWRRGNFVRDENTWVYWAVDKLRGRKVRRRAVTDVTMDRTCIRNSYLIYMTLALATNIGIVVGGALELAATIIYLTENTAAKWANIAFIVVFLCWCSFAIWLTVVTCYLISKIRQDPEDPLNKNPALHKTAENAA